MKKSIVITLAGALFLFIGLTSCQKSDRKIEKQTNVKIKKADKSYWPNDAQLVISISMQFETGGQPEGAESPFSGNPLPKGNPDMPAES
ncbi:hypothetical protein [Lacinutrix salivirga]